MEGNFSLLNACLPESLRLRGQFGIPNSKVKIVLFLPALLQREKKKVKRKKDV